MKRCCARIYTSKPHADIVAISIVKCLLNTFIFVHVHKTDSLRTRYISMLAALVSITDFKDLCT